MRRKIISIVLQLIIGISLLGLSYNYIQKNPAEKVWFLATFDIIYGKITSVGKYFNWRKSWELTELDKYKSAFNELKWVMNSTACSLKFDTDKTSMAIIDSAIKSFETITPEQFESSKSKYITIFNRINEMVNEYCK